LKHAPSALPQFPYTTVGVTPSKVFSDRCAETTSMPCVSPTSHASASTAVAFPRRPPHLCHLRLSLGPISDFYSSPRASLRLILLTPLTIHLATARSAQPPAFDNSSTSPVGRPIRYRLDTLQDNFRQSIHIR
jgi:hypothetical protein